MNTSLTRLVADANAEVSDEFHAADASTFHSEVKSAAFVATRSSFVAVTIASEVGWIALMKVVLALLKLWLAGSGVTSATGTDTCSENGPGSFEDGSRGSEDGSGSSKEGLGGTQFGSRANASIASATKASLLARNANNPSSAWWLLTPVRVRVSGDEASGDREKTVGACQLPTSIPTFGSRMAFLSKCLTFNA